MIIRVNCDIPHKIILGRQGETAVTTIEFDTTPWQEEYGEGELVAVAKRSGDVNPYPLTLVDNTWTVSNTDTYMAGRGKLQVSWIADGAVKKSVIHDTKVLPCIDATEEPPDPYETWIDQLLQLEGVVLEEAEIAQTAANEAVVSETHAAESAQAALSAKSDAETAAGNAAENAAAALSAKQAAETAAGNAATSATSAGTSAASAASNASAASTAKTAAETAAQTATNKASAAATSASNAATSAQNAGTSATNAASSARSAASSKTAAQSASATAVSAAETASSAATAAASAKTSAESAASTATSAKTAAQAAATNAATSESNAGNSATSAAASAQAAAESARTLVIDPTLTHSGQAADAKVTGDELADVKSDYAELDADKADVIISSASGAIAHFEDGADGLPVKSLKIGIEPVQEGTGDPSPENIRPITGFTGCNVFRTGRNLFGGDLMRDGVKASMAAAEDDPTNRCISFLSGAAVNGVITQGTFTIYNNDKSQVIANKFKPYTQYTFIITASRGTVGWPNLRVTYTDGTSELIPTVETTKTTVVLVTNANKSVLDFRKSTQGSRTYLYYDESGIFEGVLTADDFEPYRGTTLPIAFPTEAGTVYGGYVDVTKGKLVVNVVRHALPTTGFSKLNISDPDNNVWTRTRNNVWSEIPVGIANGYVGCNLLKPVRVSSSSIHEPYSVTIYDSDNNYIRICLPKSVADTDAAIETWLTNNPIEVVYEVVPAAIKTYDITPQQIALLLGANNVWHDANGDTDVSYKADTKLYIEQLTKPTEDDMTANTAIQSGKFFMVGNRLFLSTSTIASGDTINPGTNCTELSLADALNSL